MHDNAPAYKEYFVTKFFGVREGHLLATSSIFARPIHPGTIFCFKNSNIIYLEKDTIREMPWIFVSSLSNGCPSKVYKTASKMD